MGCGSCTGEGCGRNGGCSSGGCNKMNTYNWLSDFPISDFDKPFPLVEISFNHGSRKDIYLKPESLEVSKGDLVVVENNGGFDMGEISLTGEIVKLQIKKKRIRVTEKNAARVLRLPSEDDLAKYHQSKKREKEMLMRSRRIITNLGLKMKLAEVEMQADGKKAIFYYTAEDRVDFRELIKALAAEFRLRVEMKQIGIRQEAAKIGGIGSCGRELCCSTWLSNFKSVNTSVARYQNLAINQLKLSGQCGRLKCCLNYELDTYMEALKKFPDKADKLETVSGRAFLVKTDIFKDIMWYVYENQTRYIPLSIEEVNNILELNKKGQKAKELVAVEIEDDEEKESLESNAEYVDVVGQISLRSLDKGRRKKGGRNTRNKRRKPASNRNRNQKNRSAKNTGSNQSNKKDKPQNSKQGNKSQQKNNPPNAKNKNKSRRKPQNRNGRNSGTSNNTPNK